MKNQYKIVSALGLSLLFILSSCNFNCISGSGRRVTENRSVGTFTKVEFGGNIRLKVKQDSVSSMRITADDNIQREIKTRVKGGVLQIKMDGNFCNTGLIEIELSSKEWKGIEASGACQIYTENQLHTNDFMLDLSGASKVVMDIVASRMRTSSSGSAKVKLTGQAGAHDVDLSDAAEIQAFDFVVGNYNIETSGSSDCAINVLNSLNVQSSGASKILYKGNPKTIHHDESGAATLKHVE